ncbi:hypothetical protein [Rhodopila sp.]|uniref:hypothetical protein n=1 Tax=Rhodopila sp. TaxID=2480087 RepID=UPI003D13019D
MTSDPVTLLVNGMHYAGWKEITIERGADRCIRSLLVVSRPLPLLRQAKQKPSC